MNVGANSITDYGNYYMYGKGAAQYAATSGESYYDGTENPLAASADTATQVWGDSWHMPTRTQFNELTANTNYSFTTINGVSGGKFTNKIDSSKYIFLPAAGYWNNGTYSEGGISGVYCSSTPENASTYSIGDCDYCLTVGGKGTNVTTFYRRWGYSIRPVMDA